MSNSECPAAICPMLTVKDPSASIAFYRDVLGFELKGAWPSEDAPAWASLTLNGQVVMLGAEAREGDPGCDGPEGQFHLNCTTDFGKAPGGGVVLYFTVDDVDAYHAQVSERGGRPVSAPKNQFYGIRDFPIQDLDGYRFCFNSTIVLESCQSCAMPLAEATPGQMYCAYCCKEDGTLKTYEEVFEGTVVGFFMGMQKMERGAAEAAAKEHLAAQPAWSCHDMAK